MFLQQKPMGCKVGQPTLVINGVITPTTGVVTLLITGRGPLSGNSNAFLAIHVP